MSKTRFPYRSSVRRSVQLARRNDATTNGKRCFSVSEQRPSFPCAVLQIVHRPRSIAPSLRRRQYCRSAAQIPDTLLIPDTATVSHVLAKDNEAHKEAMSKFTNSYRRQYQYCIERLALPYHVTARALALAL